ncbi:ATP-binding cassette domain-containing protein [Vallitalea pronyensis]|uniref:ATP-binding cassette domain-containing protein n=1 Tax=Vallitalea pronyensis TaxID=1348613 RepID=A0A8J8MHI3_9FIRM|nr:ABC transporter ATP-binding protein/permease [Vallitalea pronyensis]QUI21636.1 ATP-binding cassette domain-containing protein [Vallitalea pronyensis]
MLKLENITKRYELKKKTVYAVNNVNMTFHKGEFVSILGLSGSGKTTLVSQLGGLDQPSEGRIIVNGVDTSSFKQQDWNNYRKNNIGFVFQDFHLIAHLTAKENIEIALSLSGLTPKEKSDRAEELLALMGITEQRDQLPKQLSGGQKQRVAIARALSNKPDIILADEPTGALDPDTSVQIMEILQALAENGHLVIMVTHNKYLARDYSTRIVALESGKIISNEEVRPSKQYKDDQLSTDKSSLQFFTAVKIAMNNLKIRKKSTIFSMVSLIPSMVLIFGIMNLIFNMSGYKADFKPLLGDVLGKDNLLYVTPFEDEQLESTQKTIYKEVNRLNVYNPRIEPFKNTIIEPYTDDAISDMEDIEGVDKVLRNTYFDVIIDEKPFLLMALPPKAYASYQYGVPKKHYPEDHEEGIIMSSEAAKVLLQDNHASVKHLVGTDITFNIYNYKSAAIKLPSIMEEKNVIHTKVIDIMDISTKTKLMSNYHAGYIYVSYGYAESLRERFDLDDFTLFSYSVPDPFKSVVGVEVEGGFLITGPQLVADPLRHLRIKTSLQEKYNLFQFREFDLNMRGNNYSVKHTVILNDAFNKDSLAKLKEYGHVTKSRFDAYSVESAKKTNEYINYSLLSATLIAVVVILIPTLLVCVILYVSIILRTKEIGILKSIGARNKDILNIFTMESGILALSSGIISLVVALPLIQYVRNILESEYDLQASLGSNPMDYNMLGIITAFILSVGIITMIGLLPGRKASKLQPNTLLKHE